MAKPCERIVYGFQRFCFHEIPSKSSLQKPISSTPTGFSIPRHLGSGSCSNLSPPSEISRRVCLNGFLSKRNSPDGMFSRLLSRNHSSCTLNANGSVRSRSCGIFHYGFSNSTHLNSKTPTGLPSFSSRISGLRGANENGLRFRFFSTKSLISAKIGSNAAKLVVSKPLSAVTSAFSRYREAAGLQTEAFWKRNYLLLVGAGAVVVCVALWRVMVGVASTFVGLSEGMAKYGFLALAAAMVAFAGIYIRSRLTINPDKIYRMAMRKLNTSAGILEVMGAPLTGTELRAYVMSGGGPKLKNFKMRFGGSRCFLIFPIRGSERRGLVSVEAKKKKGQYDMKLLAVDVPMATGPDQRIFLIGDEQEYKIGGGLISELRDPIVKAMAAEEEFEDLDEREDKEDEARELEEAERKQREDVERALEEAERKQHEDEERAHEEVERKRSEVESLERGSSWKYSFWKR